MADWKNGPVEDVFPIENGGFSSQPCDRLPIRGIPWVVPLPSNSDHQGYYIFSRESQPKPSFSLKNWEGEQCNNPRYPLKNGWLEDVFLRGLFEGTGLG